MSYGKRGRPVVGTDASGARRLKCRTGMWPTLRRPPFRTTFQPINSVVDAASDERVAQLVGRLQRTHDHGHGDGAEGAVDTAGSPRLEHRAHDLAEERDRADREG